MTQEEAIEVVKKNHPHVSFSDSQFETALHELVPELAEIEDEKIRKWLVDYFTEIGENWIHREFTCEQIVAYLERQKEQNLELYYDKDLDSAAREFYFSGGADSPVDSTGLVPIVRMAEFGATWMKKKTEKEQIPAEWSEEDKKDIAHIIRILDDCYVYGKHDLSKTDHDNLVNKLKSLHPSWKPSEDEDSKNSK